VTDVSRWRVDGAFKAIEGQVNAGQPKGPLEENGVYERTRYAPDVLTFARMPWKLKLKGMPTLKKNNSEVPLVIPAHLTRCMTTQQASTAKPQYRRAVEAVQLALASHPGVNFRNADRGVFNLKSRSAFAAFQRFNGVNHSAADGVPDENSLALLAEQTNLQFFRAE
jgi:peptidoglycan hydrolase-like protein with peptidoglycan-binding domain